MADLRPADGGGGETAPERTVGTEPTREADRTRKAERPGAKALALRYGGALVLVVLDLWSKAAVFAWLGPLERSGELPITCPCGHRRMHVLGEDVDWFTFMLSKNPGAAFGGFANVPHLLVGGRVLAVLFLVWMLLRTPRGRPWFTLALVLVLGGAMGNLYDNLFLIDPATSHPYGEVRDFIDVYFADLPFRDTPYHFPTFNVADSGITVGAILLFLTSFAKRPEEAAAEAPVAAEDVADAERAL